MNIKQPGPVRNIGSITIIKVFKILVLNFYLCKLKR